MTAADDWDLGTPAAPTTAETRHTAQQQARQTAHVLRGDTSMTETIVRTDAIATSIYPRVDIQPDGSLLPWAAFVFDQNGNCIKMYERFTRRAAERKGRRALRRVIAEGPAKFSLVIKS